MVNPTKIIRINGRVHHKLKLVCVKFEIKMEDLATAIIENGLKDEQNLNMIVEAIKSKRGSIPHKSA